MKYLHRVFATLLLLISCTFAMPTATYAFDPFGAACSNGGAGSTVCQDANNSRDNPLTGPDGIIMRIVNLIAYITGIIAVIIIIVAGFKMITGGGNADAVAGARRAVISAAIGLVVIVSAKLIIGYVLGKL